MDQSLVFFLAGVFIVGALLFAFINFRRGSKPVDIERFRSKCLEIEHQLKRDDVASCHMCVLNADKLLDEALKVRGVKGSTMGDRLKNGKNLFSDLNGVWAAHKLRNQIAHESDTKVSYEQARGALLKFRRGLKDLGVI